MVMEIRAFCCRGFRGTSLDAAWMTMTSALLSQRTMPISSREAKPIPANATRAAPNQFSVLCIVNGVNMCGVRTPLNQVYPLIYLPADFSNGDPFFSQVLRVTRLIKIHEKVNLSLIAEAFNIFNIANLTGYGSGLNTVANPTTNPPQIQLANFGQPSNRVNQIFGTGGPRAFQFAARITF